MHARIALVLAMGLLAGGCGNGRNDQAAAACNAEIAKKLAGKSYEIDIGDLARHVKTEAADTVVLSSTAIFDKGLSTEYKQTYDCRVRFDSTGAPSLIFVEFNWNKEDLKKAE
ncbi:MAG: hypothetical protein P4L92_06260 [Rudaea sp.]|nr:hypothetical protein [Rudaea sp.]